ncbi:Crp/Fnr family transcriptional regulator [Bradyrhizobium sp. AUGA SZCCT0177]|uniref:Crp/Fnr family transcriptional regulator n=1 Tax=Bradyrhizobium sp. AUGA SZCCT0177 TaxID=2807665 RepID=UPI001BA93DC7|nr:Crp/Fnr family transcriptional regulator [Bradyrhizobium sp. AUGA SZCCT0177]MBR1281589.1 Crp/Fnr family transcriptional regulator [Bradyrhizobium sp. AUGA SZCCT0177]
MVREAENAATLVAKREAAEIFRQAGWLASAPALFRTEIIRRSAVQHVEANSILYLAGDMPKELFGVLSGTIKIELVTAGTESQVAFIGHPGFWFGEAALIRGANRLVTVTTVSEAVLLKLSAVDFEKMAADTASLRQFAMLSVGNLELAMSTVALLLTRDPVKRIAFGLLTVAGRGSVITLSQADFATMCAVTRKTVNKTLKILRTAGVINVGYSEIEILDRPRLIMASVHGASFER